MIVYLILYNDSVPLFSNTINVNLYLAFHCLQQVSLATLQFLQDDDVPLTPIKGEPDYLADEAILEDTEMVPKGICVDQILLSNGHLEPLNT